MVADDLDLLEEGLQLIGRQVPTDSGPLDILAVDGDGALVVIELKSMVDEGQLVQGLRYYDWVASNAPWIARAYDNLPIDAKEAPRLVLVAPGFDDITKKVAKYVNIDIDLKEYVCVELPDGSKTLICHSMTIPLPPEPPKVYAIPEKLQLIQDEKVRALCEQALTSLKENGVEIRPIHGEWISCWYKNKRFMYLGCKKRFFVCEILEADGEWSNRIRVGTKKDWDELLNAKIRQACERISQGTQLGTVSIEHLPEESSNK